jgi:hypothetical protein
MQVQVILILLLTAASSCAAGANPALDRQFADTVRPFVTKYCIGCHSGATPAAQFDLKSYTSLEAVTRDYPRWALVMEKLKAQEMPPKPLPPPPADARQKVIDWIQAVRAEEVRKHAGDPGLILARRLSNAEYNYTLRDLTGQDLQPAREFPLDPANPAGFDNSGESLVMSSALLNKYLQAARDLSNHAVLTPDGIDFAPYPMLVETDREKYAIQRIVNFYFQQPTDFADYFQAAWRYQHRQPGVTLAAIAAQSKVSAKYLRLVWQILQDPKGAVGPIAKLQSMFRALPNSVDDVREPCVAMRDFVVRIRRDTGMQFAPPVVEGLSVTSQSLANWRLRQFAEHRRDFDPASLRNDTDPPLVAPTIPKHRGFGADAAPVWALLTDKSRAGDPDLVVPAAHRAEYEAAFRRFSSVFPDKFFVSERGRFFPDDSEDKGRLLSAGFHNVMGYFRDDIPLQELILDEQGRKQLDRLWIEFDFIADYTTRTWIQYYFNQSGEVQGNGRESGTLRPSDRELTSTAVIFRLRDAYLAKAAANPVALQAIRDHFARVNATIRSVEKMRADAEPLHLNALLRFAARAYRRPLSQAEREDLLAYYHKVREKNQLTHEDAIRDAVTSILMSPDFLYRLDLAPASSTAAAVPLSAYALASRLSYFLWSSMPDEELLRHAAAGDLRVPDVLLSQVRRMLKDPRARGLATEFAGNWLDFRHFETHNAVDRQRFPTFNDDLRESMFQEPVRFIEDLIRNNGSVLDMLYGSYTFVNPPLATHYGMPEVKGNADTWVRVDDARQYGRGGLLPMAVFLTQSSPGLRTSPVKRGYWVVHKLLGEVIPPPPPVVPELPSDEAKSDLPLRDMLAQHRANPVCASCHARFDSFGLAFEGYGPVGEARTRDLAGRPVDTHATFPGGAEGSGLDGVETFIRQHRQADFVDSLSRKLLAYALNRSLQLSDEPLIERMKTTLRTKEYRFDSLPEIIAGSPQFLHRRSNRIEEDAQIR